MDALKRGTQNTILKHHCNCVNMKFLKAFKSCRFFVAKAPLFLGAFLAVFDKNALRADLVRPVCSIKKSFGNCLKPNQTFENDR